MIRVNNVLENTPERYLKEVLIIDDCSDVPVQGWEDNPRVRIVRSGMHVIRFVVVTRRNESGLDQCTNSWWKRG